MQLQRYAQHPSRQRGRPLDMAQPISDEIRAILRDYGRLAVDVHSLSDQANLYDAGLSSHASVSVMLALEEHFDVEFPDRMLRRAVFGSIAGIRAALEELTGART